MDNQEKIILPKDLYEKLDLTKEVEEVEVIDIAKDSFTIRAKEVKPRIDYAPRWFLLPTALDIIVFLGFTLLKGIHLVPLTGGYSIGTAVEIIANGIAIITFILAYIARRKSLYRMMTAKIYWRTFATVVASVLIITSLVLVTLFWFFDQIFHGVQFDVFTSAFIFGMFAGILNYFIIFTVDSFSIGMLVNMLIFVVIGGLIASMASNGNPYWWKKNFSLLGTTASKSNLSFNLTLIVSGALFLALVDYIFVALSEKYGRNWRHIILRVLLTLTAVSIAGVGLVPNNGMTTPAHFWHDQIAMFIVYFMLLAILGIRWLLPQVGKNMINLSYAIIGFLLISYILWKGFHYFSLTVFEILSFSASFAWFMLLMNRLTRLLFGEHKAYRVLVAEEK